MRRVGQQDVPDVVALVTALGVFRRVRDGLLQVCTRVVLVFPSELNLHSQAKLLWKLSTTGGVVDGLQVGCFPSHVNSLLQPA